MKNTTLFYLAVIVAVVFQGYMIGQGDFSKIDPETVNDLVYTVHSIEWRSDDVTKITFMKLWILFSCSERPI